MEALQAISKGQVSDERIQQGLATYFQDHGTGVFPVPSQPNASPDTVTNRSGFLYDRAGQVAAAWVIYHDLNKYPQVTLIDDEGNEFEADIFYNNLNQVTVMFAVPTSGKAVLI
jgi:hypothetical protein